MRYVYDTNILIYYLAGEVEVLPFFDEAFLDQHEVFISPIVRIELLSFSQLSSKEIEVIEELLLQFHSVAVSHEVEDLTIMIKRRCKIKLPDAMIAASALHQQAYLVTRNAEDFKQITELTVKNPWQI
ncbi:type II toxin-antitoxin system VapC family toxin [Pseudanabaenaceae cyanobacterium LEGE 13415]|nr:type II toxin-antitoxin system VapC family toxin [Pseudanabaenaceae cyanobacterium LEGE 13415]